MVRKGFILALFVAVAAFAFAAPAGKLESTGAFSDPAASAAIKAALQPTGHHLTVYDGSVVDVWFAKDIAPAKEKDPNAVYPQIGRSSFVGVIKFERKAKDFRGQSIMPGAYAMRYELLPTDGNHMGCAAQPDFVLLTPLSEDTDPKADYDFAKLVELSGKASGTGHPAAFSLVPADDVENFPSVFYTSDGYVALAAKAGTPSGELPVALVVKGEAMQ